MVTPRRGATLPRARIIFALMLTLAATMYFFQLGRAGLDNAETYSAYIASRPPARGFPREPQSRSRQGRRTLCLRTPFLLRGLRHRRGCPARVFRGIRTRERDAPIRAGARVVRRRDRNRRHCAMGIQSDGADRRAMGADVQHVHRADAGQLASRCSRCNNVPTPCASPVRRPRRGDAAYPSRRRVDSRRRGGNPRARSMARLPVRSGCVGLAGALVLFAPIAPVVVRGSARRPAGPSLRLDWERAQTPLGLETGVSMMATAVGLILVLGPVLRFDRSDVEYACPCREPMRWCAMWTSCPTRFAGGLVAVHPMFEIRYVAPSPRDSRSSPRRAIGMPCGIPQPRRHRDDCGIRRHCDYVPALSSAIPSMAADRARGHDRATRRRKVYFSRLATSWAAAGAGLDPDSLSRDPSRRISAHPVRLLLNRDKSRAYDKSVPSLARTRDHHSSGPARWRRLAGESSG